MPSAQNRFSNNSKQGRCWTQKKLTIVEFTAIDGTWSVAVILVKHLPPLTNVRPQCLELMQLNTAGPISIKHSYTDMSHLMTRTQHHRLSLNFNPWETMIILTEFLMAQVQAEWQYDPMDSLRWSRHRHFYVIKFISFTAFLNLKQALGNMSSVVTPNVLLLLLLVFYIYKLYFMPDRYKFNAVNHKLKHHII